MWHFTRLTGLLLGRVERPLMKDTSVPMKIMRTQQQKVQEQPRRNSATKTANGAMFDKEDELPSLPVPELNQTMDRYVKALAPITLEHDLKEARRLVNEFAKPGGVGEELQAKLVRKASDCDNWLARWWDDAAYFGYRESVVINSSPGIVFPRQTFHSESDQYRYTAKLILSVLKFKHLIDKQCIPVEYSRKEPLTMVQYEKLLSMCRLPLPKNDKSIHAMPEQSRHVIIAHNNHFFALDVFHDGSESPLDEDELVQQLDFIVNVSRCESEHPVGVLTSENRNTWAQGYKHLLKDAQNKHNIESIQNSICLVCLDQPVNVPDDISPGYENVHSSLGLNQVLHGGGSKQNSMNRWFDKPCQFIVNRNGLSGVCYEHSGAEGPPVMALCNMIIENASFEHDYSTAVEIVNESLRPPEALTWNLNYNILDRIELAIDRIDDATANVDLRFFQFNRFGKNVPKMFKMSPDAFFQVTLQLAYWRLHGHHPPTYESASIRKFSRGRTECIRSATSEAATFAKEMDRTQYDNYGKKELFMKAIQSHVNYTVDAMDFSAIDRHLLGLKLTALESGMPLPEIFRDKSYTYSMHFRLSTSQVASKHEACLCFGPVVSDGYGVCYNPMEEQFLYAVSSFRSHPKTRSKDLGDEMANALHDVHVLLATTSHL